MCCVHGNCIKHNSFSKNTSCQGCYWFANVGECKIVRRTNIAISLPFKNPSHKKSDASFPLKNIYFLNNIMLSTKDNYHPLFSRPSTCPPTTWRILPPPPPLPIWTPQPCCPEASLSWASTPLWIPWIPRLESWTPMWLGRNITTLPGVYRRSCRWVEMDCCHGCRVLDRPNKSQLAFLSLKRSSFF